MYVGFSNSETFDDLAKSNTVSLAWWADQKSKDIEGYRNGDVGNSGCLAVEEEVWELE